MKEEKAYAELQEAALALSRAAGRLSGTDPEDGAYQTVRALCSSVAGLLLVPSEWAAELPGLASAATDVSRRILTRLS